MKKLIKISLCIALAIMFTSCMMQDGEIAEREDYNIITIDGCEYIKFSEGHLGYFSHKGDCKNTIH